MSLTKYLELLDWIGRQLRSGKRLAIPRELSPILNRLGLDCAASPVTVMYKMVSQLPAS